MVIKEEQPEDLSVVNGECFVENVLSVVSGVNVLFISTASLVLLLSVWSSVVVSSKVCTV